MTECAYCSCNLPERGYSHYAIVEGVLKQRKPACITCIRRLNLKIMALENDEFDLSTM